MLLFVDTEFTDLIDTELISIGIVSEDGQEFYAECSEFNLARCSDFVKAAVLPLLGRDSPFVGTEEQLSAALKNWISQFDQIEVLVDYSADFEFFYYLVRDPETLSLPGSITWRNIWSEIADINVER
jgi:hypothetical protein